MSDDEENKLRTVDAVQIDNPLRQASAKVEIEVLDVNDNAPVFEYDTYNITVMENLPPGFTVVQVYAQDKDKGENAAFRYQLEDPSGAFTIDQVAGWINVKDPAKLDRETKDTIVLKVRAVERKPNVKPGTAEGSTTVEVHLLDANDNNPRFVPGNVYHFAATEIDLPGTVVGTVKAVDPDLGLNGLVTYSLQNDSLTQTVPFVVDHHNGSVLIHTSFSDIRVKPSRYTFFVIASDQASIVSERRTSSAVINIEVRDVNNNPPEFLNAPYEAFVGESLPPGAMVFQLEAKDPDANTVLQYNIVAGNDEGLFAVDTRTGRVVTAAVLDYETRQQYDVLVQASDGVNTAVSPLTIHVVDINDQQPVFTHNFYNLSTVEEIEGEVTVGAILAVDGDSGRNAAVRYRILGDRANEAFRVADDGSLHTRRRLDREREPQLEFLVVAFDGGTPQLSGTATVAVTVLDINDNPPHFNTDTFVVHVPEEEDPPKTIFHMKAEDLDEGENAVIHYHIVGGNEDRMFDIEPETGAIFTTGRLDYERKGGSEYTLHVAARNSKPFQGPRAANLANPFVKLVVKVESFSWVYPTVPTVLMAHSCLWTERSGWPSASRMYHLCLWHILAYGPKGLGGHLLLGCTTCAYGTFLLMDRKVWVAICF
ncbi:hypothetical protein LAZ67_9002575 [Cordylochernes scorpioides]|uniref:Cadherin domain-containing protein n=1 Tax=Cordylochernes scorpioides TaxID=51811 RepID=A0ABY6KU15_9ARAC|nr:hypothetical protein LAZ67_9002575 [Cordylochernes scorpioides]